MLFHAPQVPQQVVLTPVLLRCTFVGGFKPTVIRAYCNCAATLFRFNILASREFEVLGILQRFWFDLDTEYPRVRAVLKSKPRMTRAAGTCKISLFKTVVLMSMSAVLDDN